MTTPITSQMANALVCKFCGRLCKNFMSVGQHQAQCLKNPDRKTWPRTCGKVKKKRGAQPGNQHARKYQPRIPVNPQSIIETIKKAWVDFVTRADDENINLLSRKFLRKLINGEILN